MSAASPNSRFAVDWPTDELLTRRLSSVGRTQIRWLWQDRIATGRLSLLTGHPGEGKSWVALALAAALTVGAPLPGETARRPPCHVLVASAEDDPGDTIGPRFDALGGDADRLVVIDGVHAEEGERGMVLPGDIAVLDAELRVARLAGRPYSLVIIDPLSAYLPAGMDSHRDVSVRATLAPLARLAQQHDVAILAVSHLTKGTRDTPALRAQGSVAFTAAVRTQLLLGRDPQDGEDSPIRHLVIVKSNIGPEGLGLKFTLGGGRFGWLGPSSLTGRELSARHGDTQGKDGGTLAEAEDVLRQILAGGAVSAAAGLQAAADAGISEASIRRARRALGVETVKRGFGAGGGWAWAYAAKASPQNDPLISAPPKASEAVTHTGADGLSGLDGLAAARVTSALADALDDSDALARTVSDPDGALDPPPPEALALGPDGGGWNP